MTTALSRYERPCFRGMRTFGSSDTAQYVAEGSSKLWAHFRTSNSLRPGMEVAIDELQAVAKECSSFGWDGYDSAPVEQEAIRQAERFLKALPLGMVAPSIGAEPDGHITLEWYQSPRRTLSVSINQDGDLHYAALLGYSKQSGFEPFFGEMPLPILNLVKRAISA